MRRRDFIWLIGAAALHPLAAAAEPKVPVIGVLVAGKPDPQPFLKGFRAGLREHGYIEGENIRLDIRSAEGDDSRLPKLAAQLVAEKVDVIVGWQTPTVTAAKQATTKIPIVMEAGAPVETGLIASLAHPGGNITGVTGTTAELAQKNLEFLRQILPRLRRIAVLLNVLDPFSKPFAEQNRLGAKSLGIELVPVSVHGPEHLESGIATAIQEKVGAAIIQPSLGAKRSAELALAHRLPAASVAVAFGEAGGLLSYSAMQSALYREVAAYLDKILRGAKPADLPVEEPTRFELIVNLKTAKALGLTVPPSLLARADEVIE
ncbi:MAG TPA: ABC transporter substrate-binding protein [Stellaceae bacterium]|nr:ABC transporter substrate-binding protein [Stellaceae bacterium]